MAVSTPLRSLRGHAGAFLHTSPWTDDWVHPRENLSVALRLFAARYAFGRTELQVSAGALQDLGGPGSRVSQIASAPFRKENRSP